MKCLESIAWVKHNGCFSRLKRLKRRLGQRGGGTWLFFWEAGAWNLQIKPAAFPSFHSANSSKGNRNSDFSKQRCPPPPPTPPSDVRKHRRRERERRKEKKKTAGQVWLKQQQRSRPAVLQIFMQPVLLLLLSASTWMLRWWRRPGPADLN